MNEDVAYPDELGLRLPLLVLSPELDEASEVFWQPGSSRSWMRLIHQCAGVGCAQVEVVGTILTPRPETLSAMERISRELHSSNIGAFGPPLLDELVAYDRLLESSFAGLWPARCRRAYPLLLEGLYPIDIDGEENAGLLEALASDQLPADLDRLLEWNGEATDPFFGKWRLLILADNSD
ncbi:hypothetical protein [Miltoncostaea oceani]|uniref:hypothetical protein n=1 Tax=Miltoncostaea oceani TaxID=2843216 RepID=UPI001C3E7437|nr:hypothetical protein [Miltoncostaea oceani]